MSSSSPLRHDLSPSLPNPTKRGRNHPRLPEPTLTAMSTAATLPRRDSPATDCLPLTPHGLVCKTPVTTHACLLGSACTASRRCLLLPKTERPRVWCTQHLSKSSGLPHISTHTSDHNIDATRSTSTGRRDYVPSSRSIPAPAGMLITLFARCKECGGGSICQHNRIRSKCKTCIADKDESMPLGLEEL